MQDTGNYYLISHLVLLTGLTDRTIRNYIAMGVLRGEKINGMWHFTPEEVESFVQHPAVRPSILAKNNGMVHGFLVDTNKMKEEACLILDIPQRDKKEIAEFFCYQISNGGYHDIQLSYDGAGKLSRVILIGNAAEVICLANAYSKAQSLSQPNG